MTLSRTTSSQLLQSVLLTPASSQIIPPPPPPANYVLLLSTILTPLYKSSAPEEPGYLNLYRWITGSTPSISIEPANEKKIARMKVRELFFLKNTPDQEVEIFTETIFKAHFALTTACLSLDKNKVATSIADIQLLAIPDAAKNSFVSLMTFHPEHKKIFNNVGLLGFASFHHQTNIVNQLLMAGADANFQLNNNEPPIFFSVAADKNPLTPYETLRTHVHIYLENNFDINKIYQNKNILQYALAHNRKDIARLIEHKISDLYKKGKISFQQLQVFCTQLMRTNQLKLFPTLITYKKIYKTAEEEDYYHSQALLDTLIDFCEYAKLRIDSEIRSMVLPAGKSAALQKMIEELKKLQQEEFLGDYTGMDMTNYFSDPILRLEKILSMPRVTLYAGKSTTANTEWKAFYQDNEEILLKTARASNRLQHVF